VPTPAPKLKLVDARRDSEGAMPTTPSAEDMQLVATVRAADPGAAEALYERMRPTVGRTLNRLLGRNDPEHQDLSQQTMVEVVRTIDRYRGDGPLDAWISTVAAHVVYKYMRHRAVERRVLADVLLLEPGAADDAADRAALRSTIDRVCEHVASIDPGRAWAFLLHDVHGHGLREVADIMSISPAAAQSRLVRARKELHARFAADPELAAELERAAGRAGRE
jgi:RNA polymerase sigma-70 factor (ECF subfamily)